MPRKCLHKVVVYGFQQIVVYRAKYQVAKETKKKFSLFFFLRECKGVPWLSAKHQQQNGTKNFFLLHYSLQESKRYYNVK